MFFFRQLSGVTQRIRQTRWGRRMNRMSSGGVCSPEQPQEVLENRALLACPSCLDPGCLEIQPPFKQARFVDFAKESIEAQWAYEDWYGVGQYLGNAVALVHAAQDVVLADEENNVSPQE